MTSLAGALLAQGRWFDKFPFIISLFYISFENYVAPLAGPPLAPGGGDHLNDHYRDVLDNATI